ncbi:MAG: endolytic transglycosylase MltG, partial [Candidatus Peribacteraceae bacterium]
TRKFRGLPPGPIASPGQQSIVAAFNPSETEYWYYLHDPEGRIYYARTNEEHNINRYLYLR